MKSRTNAANLTARNSKDSQSVGRDADASIPEEPGAPVCRRQEKTVRLDLCGGRWVTGDPAAVAAGSVLKTAITGFIVSQIADDEGFQTLML